MAEFSPSNSELAFRESDGSGPSPIEPQDSTDVTKEWTWNACLAWMYDGGAQDFRSCSCDHGQILPRSIEDNEIYTCFRFVGQASQ
jgi:hypothetical protein